MKLNRKVTVCLVALACLVAGVVAGSIWATFEAVKSREAYTQLMWFGFYAKQDMLVDDIYFNRPPADAIGALLAHSRRMEDEKEIILAAHMLGTNYFNQSLYFLNARLSKLYSHIGRPQEAQHHMSNAVAIVTEWKGATPEPSAVLKDVEVLDSIQREEKTDKPTPNSSVRGIPRR